MIRTLWLFVLLIFVTESEIVAQTIGDGKTGAALISFLRSNYRPTATLSYKDARKKMFAEIDNRNGFVRCVYTGVDVPTNGIPSDSVMNTEHTWPQSKFQKRLPMKSDLFHLFPTISRVNSERSNNPFGEIPDDQTEFWWRSSTGAANVTPQFLNECSESVDDRFEPREDHKGNVARAMLYVWVVYGNDNITPTFINSQLPTLLNWHAADPVNETERKRDEKIQSIQGNNNPFILDPTLAGRVAAIAKRGANSLAKSRITATSASASQLSLRVTENRHWL